MKHSICCIDDKIPVSKYPEFFKETEALNEQVLRFLLINEKKGWEDSEIKSLFAFLIDNSSDWSVSAFTHPAFYYNYREENVYSPDVFVYDWDYNFAPGSAESEEYLYKILDESYSMVFIFSGADTIDDINSLVHSEKFSKFADRLELVNKNEDDCVDLIVKKIGEKEKSNFAFSYGHDIIQNSNKAINKILSEISQLSIHDFIASIGIPVNDKIVASNKDFIDIVIPRYKSSLNNIEWKELSVDKQKKFNIDSIRQIWSYRMYDNSPTDEVSMGDIVKKEKGGYFLIVSSDCHMARFWQKNGGYISMIPLQRINSVLGKNQRKLLVNSKPHFSSVNSSQIPMTLLPAVPVSSAELRDFMVLPKSLISVKINEPTTGKKSPLRYDLFKGYSKVVSIVDPYKSPLIHFIMNNITGYGCPDFSDEIQEYLLNRIK